MRKPDGKRLAATLRFALSALLLCSFVQTTRAQDETGTAAPPQPGAARRGGARTRDDAASLLMQLNLSPEQRAQLIEIRSQSAAEGQALGRRLNQARKALDAAIYADNVEDEAVIEERAREVASALSAVLRMRALTELRVRRVLTPEQLNLFRQLRREAARKQRLERRVGREGEGGDGERPRRPRPLFDNRPNRRPNSPPDNTPAVPARLRRPQP